MTPRWWKPPASISACVFLITFLLGSALAGLGGLMGGAFLSLYPSADAEILVFSLAVVIIGGRGSLVGVGVGSLLVGLLNTLRPGDVSRTGLFRDLRPDGGAAGVPSARPVRTCHMTTPLAPQTLATRRDDGPCCLIAVLVVIAAAVCRWCCPITRSASPPKC